MPHDGAPTPTIGADLQRLAERLAEVDGLEGALERRRDDLVRTLSVLVARLEHPDDALLAVVVGPTGSGRSSLLNAVAGHTVSAAGARRPTTTSPVVWCQRGRAPSHRSEGVAGSTDVVVVGDDHPLLATMTVLDVPDPDATRGAPSSADLLSVADLAVLVATPGRYGDGIPWEVLASLSAAGVPLIPVMNRVRDDASARLLVGHLVQRARAEGLPLDLDEVLRVPERPGGPTAEDVVPLATLLAAVASEDVTETIEVARQAAVRSVVANAARFVDDLDEHRARAARRDRANAVAVEEARSVTLERLRRAPPGVATHGAVILRLPQRGAAPIPDAALAAVEPRLVSAAAVDLAAAVGGDPPVLADIIRRAAAVAGVVDAAPRAALLLSLGIHAPTGLARPLPDTAEAFFTALASMLHPIPLGAPGGDPPDLHTVLATASKAAL